MNVSAPFVSVVTPVYNGQDYLEECIKSVLSQTHQNFEYIIVNNCSTDATLSIAERYAQADRRIQVHDYREFVGIIENHNRALSLISTQSQYCKVLSADDWLYPEFLARTVELAHAHHSIAIVGSYQLSGGNEPWRVRWTGLPYYCTFVPGRNICRQTLLGGRYVFGTPTSTLYRADIVRDRSAFYPHLRPNADVASYYEYLKDRDFGFVHQVLSYERIHKQATTSGRRKLNTHAADQLRDFLTYGPVYLLPEEFAQRKAELIDDVYDVLARGAVNVRDRKFWEYHRRELQELGCPLYSVRTGRAVVNKLLDLILNPKQTMTKVLKRAKTRGGVALEDAIVE